jgi:hypothetical protein
VSSVERRIFVNIASYRDTECQWTVRDLFEKAENPDRIFVGICWQFAPETDQDCFTVETRPAQVRRVDFHPKESRGVCWARNHAQKLLRGEEFTLQIDSHMRFVAGWDRVLLEMYEACLADRAVLSTYPSAYEPPNTLMPPLIATILPKEFDGRGMFRVRSVAVPPEKAPAAPTPTAYVAAGFLFAPSGIIEDVPYDPHIYFQGEEITLAARLWTHGWDLFTPNRHVIYHDYTQRGHKNRHWEDSTDWSAMNKLSERRVRHLLSGDDREASVAAGDDALVEIDKFGLGEVRSLSEYEAFSGVRFGAGEIDPWRLSSAVDPTTDRESAKRERVFTSIWKQRDWGNAESVSGGGATLAETGIIRQRLPEIFQELDIQILGDAGCGDLNWMSRISDRLRLYLGFDIVPGLLTDLRETYGERKSHFFSHADIVKETLPACDAILCRDCLTHMTFDEARAALQGMRRSGSTYLFATTHLNGHNAEPVQGGWHAMNLVDQPFRLPAPLRVIEESQSGSGKSLGLWRLADLPD